MTGLTPEQEAARKCESRGAIIERCKIYNHLIENKFPYNPCTPCLGTCLGKAIRCAELYLRSPEYGATNNRLETENNDDHEEKEIQPEEV